LVSLASFKDKLVEFRKNVEEWKDNHKMASQAVSAAIDSLPQPLDKFFGVVWNGLEKENRDDTAQKLIPLIEKFESINEQSFRDITSKLDQLLESQISDEDIRNLGDKIQMSKEDIAIVISENTEKLVTEIRDTRTKTVEDLTEYFDKRIKEMEERFRKRYEVRSKNMKVLSTNNPQMILKLETKKRIETRKSLISNEEGATLETLITGNAALSINYLSRGQRVSKSVCIIEVKNSAGRTLQFGTGFMVSPELLITAGHVLPFKENCVRSIIQFNYEEDENFIPKPDKIFLLDPGLFFYNNHNLDFALVGVKQMASDNKTHLSDFGYIKLIGKPGIGLIGEYATLIYHWGKERKQVLIRENRICDTSDNFINYKAKSSGASSGAPVFNDHWDVFALHHNGTPKKDEKGRTLAIDNTVWEPSMGIDKMQFDFNEGIRISKIIEDLETMNKMNKFQGESKEVLEEFLSLSKN
jgi:Trypsin-like peptidase domain